MSNQPSLREHLVVARDEQELVEVTRGIPDADTVEGCVLEVGEAWVLLAGFNWDGVVLDRYVALRVADVIDVEPLPHRDFKRKVLELRGQWPPESPAQQVQLDDTGALIRSMAAQSGLINVETENDEPDECFIGVVVRITGEALELLEVDPDAEWADSSEVPLRDITWVEFGGPYESALWAVAGAPPTEGTKATYCESPSPRRPSRTAPL